MRGLPGAWGEANPSQESSQGAGRPRALGSMSATLSYQQPHKVPMKLDTLSRILAGICQQGEPEVELGTPRLPGLRCRALTSCTRAAHLPSMHRTPRAQG